MAPIPSDRPGSELVELDVSDGDDLPAAIQSALGDGVQVYVPPGEYTGSHSDLDFSAADATIYGDPAGVSIDCEYDSNATMDTAGTLRIENIDILGKKPEEQIKINVDLSGGRLEWVNFNFPDGTANPTDSYVARCDSGSGEQLIKNCYFGPIGNSAFYYSERNTEEMPVTFEGCAFHNCAGPIRAGGVTVRDCLYLADGTVPNFREEGSSSEDRGTPRMFKFEGGGTTVIENCDALITEEAGPADGPCLDWGGDATDSNTIEVSNSRFGNFRGREIFDTASAPDGVAGDSSLSSVSVVSEPVFSGDEIPGEVTNGDEPRTDIESRRWNPLEGSSDSEESDSGSDDTFGLPQSFDVVSGSDATAPKTDYTVWTPVENPEPPQPVADGGDSGNGNGGPSELVVRASAENPDTDCDVSITVDGAIEYGDESEPDTDRIVENDDGSFTATSVDMNPDAVDSYLVSGPITAVAITDGYDATLTLDGEELDLAEFGGGESRELVLEASPENPDTNCDVSVTADGEIEFGEESEPGTDRIVENDDGSYTATSVEMNPGALDSYQVSGTITEFVVTDGYEVSASIAGQTIPIGELVGDGQDTSGSGPGDDSGNGRGGSDNGDGDNGNGTAEQPKVLIIDSSATPDEAVEYEFTVTGELTRDAERSTAANEGLTTDLTPDSVTGNRAVGAVGDGRDAFLFTGKVQSLSLSGAGIVEVRDS